MSITALSNPLARPMAGADRTVSAAMERLATGRRIVRASDDAAGLGVAERLLARHSGLAVAERNVRDGLSAIGTADGALAELHEQLQRVRELAVQWSNGALSATDRAAIETEATAFGAEAARAYEQTAFNGFALLQGGEMSFQVGASDGDSIATMLPDLATMLEENPFTFTGAAGSTTETPDGKAKGYWKKQDEVSATTTTTTAPAATGGMRAIERVDWAIDQVTRHRGSLGAAQTRLEYRLGALATEREQLMAAESRIRDADVAQEVTALTRASILRSAQLALADQARGLDRRRALALLA